MRKHPILFTLIAVALLLVALIVLNGDAISRLALAKLQKNLREEGIITLLKEPELRFIGLSSPELLIQFEGTPASFPLKHFDFELADRPLLTGTFNAKSSAFLYDGKILFQGEQTGETLKGDLQLTKINVSQNPMLAGFGFTSGLLTGNVSDFNLHRDTLLGDATLDITKLEKPDETTLAALFTGLPFDITLPSFLAGNIHLEIEATESKLYIKTLNFQSSLGKITASGTIGNDKAHALKFRGEVDLSEEGATKLGDYLPLLSLGQLKRANTTFSFVTSGTTRFANTTFTPR